MMLIPIISIILSIEKTNSVSPYTLTRHKFVTTRSRPKIAIHIALLIDIQNSTMTAAATMLVSIIFDWILVPCIPISAGKLTILLYILFHPVANDRAGSTKGSA